MREVLFFLPYILFLGIISTYTDIKHGKIRNKWLIGGLLYSFIVYTSMIAYYSINPALTISRGYITEIITNFLFAAFFGFVLWYYGIWTAGDGKLFLTYAALIPPSTYSLGYLSVRWVPSAILFLNTFSIGLIWMLFLILHRAKMHELYGVLESFVKGIISPKMLLDSTVILFAVLWVVQLILSPIGFGGNIFFVILLVILISTILKNRIGKRYVWILLSVAVLRLVIDKSLYSIIFIRNFILLVILWAVFNQFMSQKFLNLSKEIFSREIRASELKEGMVLVDNITQRGKRLEMTPKIIFAKDKSFIEEEAEGLTAKQIAKIRKAGIKSVRVAQTISFAPLLFLGVIATIILKGNIFIWFKLLLR